MRAIDADALERILSNAIGMMELVAQDFDMEDDKEFQMEIKAYTDILNGVKEQPTIEPALIRCKDCKHAKEDALCGGYWCNGKAVTSYHYCGYAERRTDE